MWNTVVDAVNPGSARSPPSCVPGMSCGNVPGVNRLGTPWGKPPCDGDSGAMKGWLMEGKWLDMVGASTAVREWDQARRFMNWLDSAGAGTAAATAAVAAPACDPHSRWASGPARAARLAMTLASTVPSRPLSGSR